MMNLPLRFRSRLRSFWGSACSILTRRRIVLGGSGEVCCAELFVREFGDPRCCVGDCRFCPVSEVRILLDSPPASVGQQAFPTSEVLILETRSSLLTVGIEKWGIREESATGWSGVTWAANAGALGNVTGVSAVSTNFLLLSTNVCNPFFERNASWFGNDIAGEGSLESNGSAFITLAPGLKPQLEGAAVGDGSLNRSAVEDERRCSIIASSVMCEATEEDKEERSGRSSVEKSGHTC